MGAKERLRSGWRDLRESVLYDILVVPVLSGGVLAIYKGVKYVFGVLTALTPDETGVVAIVVTSWLVAAIAATYGATARSRVWPVASGPPQRLVLTSPPPPLVPTEPKDPDLRIAFDEVLFRQKGGFVSFSAWYVLARITVTNHGNTEVTAKDWYLKVSVGDFARGGVVAENGRLVGIPEAWYLSRREDGNLGGSHEERIEPDLAFIGRSDGFPKGKHRTGWLLFEVTVPWQPDVAPVNAQLELVVHDSLGNVHGTTYVPQWYRAKAEIKYRDTVKLPDSAAR